MNNRRNIKSDMLAVGGYFLLQLLASLAVAAIATAYFYVRLAPEGLSGDALLPALSEFYERISLHMVAASNILILAALLVISLVLRRGFVLHCRLKAKPEPLSSVLFCIAAGFTANFWLSFLLNSSLIPQTMLEGYSEAYQTLAGPLPLELFTLVLLAPLVEEIIFRGIIFSHLKNIVPTGAAVLLQAMLFGCVHGEPLWIAYAFALGCVIGLVRVRCASVWAGVAFHMAFNATSYLFTLFADTMWENVPIRMAAFVASAVGFIAAMWKITSRPKLVK